MRTREEVRSTLDLNFKRLMDCLGQLTEEELTSAAAAGKWTAKDVIAHVWTWNDETLAAARAWTRPRTHREEMDAEDAWNEAQVTAKQGRPLITVVDATTGSHRRPMHIRDTASDEALQQVGRAPWNAEVTLLQCIDEMAAHYLEHADALLTYQRRCLDPDSPDCD